MRGSKPLDCSIDNVLRRVLLVSAGRAAIDKKYQQTSNSVK